MALDGSPKKFALDVAGGLAFINLNTLKRYTPVEVKKILEGLELVSKELRSTAIESGDIEGLKQKGLRSQRVHGAIRTINTYLKELEKMKQLNFLRKKPNS